MRTPTATITDLGTKFGVDADGRGRTTAHVFEGTVLFRVTNLQGSPQGDAIVLGQGEAAVVKVDGNKIERTIRVSAGPAKENYVQYLPRRVPIRIFNTGVDLLPGSVDPHWQITAMPNSKDYAPKPAIVISPDYKPYQEINSQDSQWIAPADESSMPPGLYTYRTQFQLNLKGMLPKTAVLRGGFAVDNHVEAIRFNGHEVPVPWHDENGQWIGFGVFEIKGDAFVNGTNTLEIVVRNNLQNKGEAFRGDNPTALRVKIEGSVENDPFFQEIGQ